MAETSFGSRLKHAWNAFWSKNPTEYRDIGPIDYVRPDRVRVTRRNERTIVNSIINRIALDVADIQIQHVRLDKDGRYIETIESGLNDCLNLEANIDQTGWALKHDAVISMLDEGVVAVIPVDTTFDPNITDSYDIKSMRVGKIVEWYPQHIKTKVYNEKTGKLEDIILPKKAVAIIENPFYTVMNEPNSTLQRLTRKLSLLDAIDEQSSSGKLDLIVQLPYTIKTEARRQQAETRRKDIEMQLTGSKYGIAYTDGTERITQLNRPIENNLLKQIEYLTSMLFSQLGITQGILDGTADEQTMLNYFSRVVKVIAKVFVDEMKRKFLTKTARTKKQSIMYFRNLFELTPVDKLAELSDKLTRNEIASSNEIRQLIGWKPSSDPKADQLVNSNISQPDGRVATPNEPVEQEYESYE